MATSVVTPVAGLVAGAPDTLTRPAAISSLACSRDRASRRRTSSASRRCRRGGTAAGSGAGRAVERLPQPFVSLLEDGRVLLDRAVVEPVHGGEHVVDLLDARALRLPELLSGLGRVDVGVEVSG